MTKKTLGDLLAKEAGLKTMEEVLAEDEGSIDGVFALLKQLHSDLERGATDDWANPTLDSYLDGMSAWLESVRPRLGKPSWKLIEIMLRAAKDYE